MRGNLWLVWYANDMIPHIAAIQEFCYYSILLHLSLLLSCSSLFTILFSISLMLISLFLPLSPPLLLANVEHASRLTNDMIIDDMKTTDYDMLLHIGDISCKSVLMVL